MAVAELHNEGEQSSFEHGLETDKRVQQEFEQLSRFLAEVDHLPATEPVMDSDPNWHLDDLEISRWRVVVKGRTRLDRIAQFRSELQKREEIIDARVERFDHGEISIRLVTTGGIPMGPLERAVSALTRDTSGTTQTD